MDATASHKAALIARGRLKEARKLFAHRGWEVLPQGIRGQRILAWCACMAWNGYPSDPEAAVRRICGGLASYLKEHELAALIDATRVTNRRFSHDESAAVLEIPVSDCLTQGLRFLGADDDPDYKDRHKAKKARNAACQRRRRAAKSTGRKGGRPRLELSPEERAARKAQDAERKRAERAAKRSGRPRGRPKLEGGGAKNASGKTPSPYKIRITSEVTELIRTDFSGSGSEPGAKALIGSTIRSTRPSLALRGATRA